MATEPKSVTVPWVMAATRTRRPPRHGDRLRPSPQGRTADGGPEWTSSWWAIRSPWWCWATPTTLSVTMGRDDPPHQSGPPRRQGAPCLVADMPYGSFPTSETDPTPSAMPSAFVKKAGGAGSQDRGGTARRWWAALNPRRGAGDGPPSGSPPQSGPPPGRLQGPGAERRPPAASSSRAAEAAQEAGAFPRLVLEWRSHPTLAAEVTRRLAIPTHRHRRRGRGAPGRCWSTTTSLGWRSGFAPRFRAAATAELGKLSRPRGGIAR